MNRISDTQLQVGEISYYITWRLKGQTTVDLMLDQRRRQWANIEPTLAKRLVFVLLTL